MLSVVSSVGVLRAHGQLLQSSSHGRSGRYLGLLQHSLRLFPAPWCRFWSSLSGIQRNMPPLCSLPEPLSTQNMHCSKQIILGLGMGRRGITGQRKRISWCHTREYLSVWQGCTEDCNSGPSTHGAESSCGMKCP